MQEGGVLLVRFCLIAFLVVLVPGTELNKNVRGSLDRIVIIHNIHFSEIIEEDLDTVSLGSSSTDQRAT